MNTFWKVLPVVLLFIAGGCNKTKDALPGGPPADPTVPAQFCKNGTTRLPWGAVTGEDSVVLSARVTSVPDTLQVRLNVEVVREGMPFTGLPTACSSFGSSGRVANAVAQVPQAGHYSWRAWSEDQFARISGFVTFLAGPGAAFIVDPSAPTVPTQLAMDGATLIGVGDQTLEVGVLLQATVRSLAGNMVRAQFEVKPLSVPFDESALLLGAATAGGEASRATALVAADLYHWRVRAEDYDGTISSWVEFGGNDDAVPAAADFARAAATATTIPDAPSLLDQRHTDGVTIIPAGGTTVEDKVILSGFVNDAGGSPCALEVEVKPMAALFDGAGTVTGSFVPGGSTAMAAVFLSADSFHWRSRTVGSFGLVSGWTLFGSYYGGTPSPDFSVLAAMNSVPDAPTYLQQYQRDGVTGMSPGEALNGPGMVVKATVRDSEYGSGLVLEVEVKPVGMPFSNLPSAASFVVSSGSVAAITLTGLQAGSAYHWQARAIDGAGAASNWVEFMTVTPSTPSTAGSSGGGCSGSISAPSGSGFIFWALMATLILGLATRRV
jgi:hypothetical protein